MNTIQYYSTIETPVGELTLRASCRGLTGLFMHQHRHGPTFDERAAWQQDDGLFIETRFQLNEYFAGQRRRFDLPLDFESVRGTAFQRTVWQELQAIPYGETISYGELARRIGQPSAVRAVGAANGRNPISIIVPCHRVIGASGTLTGYGGGLPSKQILLGLEKRSRPDHEAMISRQEVLSLAAA